MISNHSDTPPGSDTDAVNDSGLSVTTYNKRNRKSKKDRCKHIHNSKKCIRPHCFSCAKENVVNLTGKSLSRQQITLLSKGLSYVPRTPESSARDIMIDLGTFIRNTKIKCGRLLTQSKRTHTKKSKHIDGTPSLIPHYEEGARLHRQTDWPSNRLLSSQMEDTFHAMRQELSTLADRVQRFQKTIIQPYQKRTNSPEQVCQDQFSGIQRRSDKTTCIVVKNRKDYVRERMTHLSDTNTYMRLDRDYTPDVVEYIRYTLRQYGKGGLLSDHMIRQCIPILNVERLCSTFSQKHTKHQWHSDQ